MLAPQKNQEENLKNFDTGRWELADGVEIKEDTFGFVYEIINLVDKKHYIGKKQCFSKKRKKPLKGKKRARLSVEESDWKTYVSSSNQLQADIKRLGIENFRFIILHACRSKWELAYKELVEQIQNEVIFREDYYNGILNVRIPKAPSYLRKTF